ncbi:MAG: RDD family protein, partial [Cellulosimicrobium funkei]
WSQPLVFAIENVLLVSTLGFTVGHRVMGIRVRRLAEPARMVGLGRGVLRTVLLCLVIPAVVWDADGRGLHDRAAGTVLVRS